MQCLFIHPNWRMIEDGIQETIAQINGILETRKNRTRMRNSRLSEILRIGRVRGSLR